MQLPIDARSARRFARSAGLLLHPTSLPGPHGVGDLGSPAYGFVDQLVSASQGIWQILPLGPVGYGNSPYAARSAFAGNPLLIALDDLRADGLLSRDDLDPLPTFPEDHIDYGAAVAYKMPRLWKAAMRAAVDPTKRPSIDAFRSENAWWLDDFATFIALHEAHGGVPWQSWDADEASRRLETQERVRAAHAEAIQVHCVLQYFFWDQWLRLRRYANERGVRFIGDIPMFVALDSADVWSHPDIFQLDDRAYPTVVAGVPPDYFSATGQRWGNPLYRWEALASDGFAWWIDRLRWSIATIDAIRIDHFRGFAASWEIPASHPTAEHGRWAPAPGPELFAAATRALGQLPLIAEDLGVITTEVVAMREEMGCPGMKVLQFAFDSGPANPFLPHSYDANVVVYTGTHDNDTTVGWFSSRTSEEQDFARRYLGTSGDDIAWDMIRLALSSVADLAVVPAQDLLRLGSEARMNFPGKAEGNWEWRLRPNQITAEHLDHLRRLTEVFGRASGPRVSD